MKWKILVDFFFWLNFFVVIQKQTNQRTQTNKKPPEKNHPKETPSNKMKIKEDDNENFEFQAKSEVRILTRFEVMFEGQKKDQP